MTVIIIHYSNESVSLIFFSLLVGRTSSHVLKERVNSRTKKVLLLWSSIISPNLDLKLSDQKLWINPCQKFWHEFSLFAHILQLPSRKKTLNISERGWVLSSAKIVRNQDRETGIWAIPVSFITYFSFSDADRILCLDSNWLNSLIEKSWKSVGCI